MFLNSFFLSLLLLPLFTAAIEHHAFLKRGLSHARKSLTSPQVRSLVARAEGTFTFFRPGLGACGGHNGDNDHIVAMSVQAWDGGAHCGEQISITINGRTTTATIVDMCMSCGPTDLDFSPGLFQWFGGTEAQGVMHGSWTSASERQAQEEAERRKQEEEEARRKEEEERRKQEEEEEEARRKEEEEAAAAAAAASRSAAEAAAASTSSSATTTTSTSAAPSSSASASDSTASSADTDTEEAGLFEQAGQLLIQMGQIAVLTQVRN